MKQWLFSIGALNCPEQHACFYKHGLSIIVILLEILSVCNVSQLIEMLNKSDRMWRLFEAVTEVTPLLVQ